MKQDNNYINDPHFSELLIAYRNSLVIRYSKENRSRFPEYNSLSEDKIDALISFFLNFLYPPISERRTLDEAFNSLASFVNNPSKIWGILGNLALSIFQFGRHFVSALKAGLAALHSYVSAHRLEGHLLELARPILIQRGKVEELEFQSLIGKIPEKEATEFREDIQKLFRIFSNKTLVDKIILIMEDVLSKMQSKKDVYSEIDRKGIELGISILKEGKKLFSGFSEAEMLLTVEAIGAMEKDYWERGVNADGRSRTDTMLPSVDFESTASTNSTTSAN